MVTKGQNKWHCNTNCLNSAICSHTLAVAQLDNDLTLYNSSNNKLNVTSLAMSGLCTGQRCKGRVAERVRYPQKKKTLSYQFHVSQLYLYSQLQHKLVLVVPASPFQSSLSHTTNAFKLTYLLSCAVISASQTAPQSTYSIHPNANPFLCQGNIRMCQGCRSSLRLQDGSFPFNIVFARPEQKATIMVSWWPLIRNNHSV